MFTDVYRRVANGTIVWSLFDSQIFGLTHRRLAHFGWIGLRERLQENRVSNAIYGCPGNFALNQSIDLFDTLQQKRRTILIAQLIGNHHKLPREMWQTAKTCIILVVL